MNKYICIHGHFYQPPRENPWLEDIELQDSAYPYHDWNEKIAEECYRQNAASRILSPDKKIIDIVNNYSKISFDFGPTLLIWLQKYAPDIYERIQEADKRSAETFSGHGTAMAQAYNHMIMPLANTADKYTQVIWGIRDFERHFSRKPEGMWLPETAVDLETLDILAEHDIKFTVLAPSQARRVRKVGQEQWNDVDKETLDTRRPYLCKLPSGRAISLFFYHGPVSHGVAYGGLLHSGDILAGKIMEILDAEPAEPQLAHIATDGETYGHHLRNTDMALAYCLHHVESNNLAHITTYGEYLEKFPPSFEVEIIENTSWSCAHGVERWKSNCGCCTNQNNAGKQQWREPLRKALDLLRDKLIPVYEDKMRQFVADPWKLRNEYIAVLQDRDIANGERFIAETTGGQQSFEQKVTFLKLLEMQRNAMLMYTSCGWFFDDISGIEAVQIMHYASRTIQLAKEVQGGDFEPEFMSILEQAPTNTKGPANGKEVYEAFVKPSSIDLNRVGAHLAVSSIFDDYPAEVDVYCYSAKMDLYDRTDAGIQRLAVGRASVQSKIVLEKDDVDFAVLHFGDHNLICAVGGRMPDDTFDKMQQKLKQAFRKGDTTEIMQLMTTTFVGNSYSLWHLFKDEQRRILYELLQATWEEIEASFRHIYEYNYTIMQLMRGMNIPLPKALSTPAEFILNQDLCREIQNEKINIDKLRTLTDEVDRLSLQLDEATIRFEASRRINILMGKLQGAGDDVNLLSVIENTIDILRSVAAELDLQKAQNILFAMSKEKYPDMKQRARSGSEPAKQWMEHFDNLARYLGVAVQ
jgi:alpha-amylase/alpha-mannosidase (GH57 family)